MDTIAAIATPLARCSVGMLRVSGARALEVAGAVFSCAGGLLNARERRLTCGTVTDAEGHAYDRCMAAVMRAPHSFTGEDTVEIYCHGSPAVLAKTLALLTENGARMARPGEFTRRAFLNGKMDLSGAEAVADLIDARTDAAARSAAAQLGGTLARMIDDSYERLASAAANFQAEVDFPEEDIDPLTRPALKSLLNEQTAALARLLSTFERGRVLREGLPCAIIGKPNAGKSSVLNLLLGRERAIVTPLPGTTRDTIEESAVLGGVMLRLTDSAGIRACEDPIEALGIERARAAAGEAALILLVLDGSRPLDENDLSAMALTAQGRAVVLINKSDLPLKLDGQAVRERFDHVFSVSALENAGFEALSEYIGKTFGQPDEEPDGTMITNLRHAECIKRALDCLTEAAHALEVGFTSDVLLCQVEEAMGALGEITGKNVSEDIVERIFSRFCVGK